MKDFVKYILKAQIASDAGKGFVNGSKNDIKAIDRNYAIKDLYIKQSISAARKLLNVRVSRDFDFNIGMTVVYFDIDGFGQVSFHTYQKYSKVSTGGVWNGIVGGSVATCKRLARAYRLKYSNELL